MNLLGNILSVQKNLKRNLFRRDAETSFYSQKPFPLPKINPANPEYRNLYPFKFEGDPAEVRKIYRSICNPEEVIKAADHVINNVIFLPGRKQIFTGERIHWNKDYSTGFEWKKELPWKSDFLSINSDSDIMNAWMPGRLNQLIYLGKAYLVSEDEKYVENYLSIFRDFRDQNNFFTGVNWVNTGEAGIRLLNMILSLPLIIHSRIFDENFFNEFREFILLHSIFIENNFEHSDSAYYYLADITSLAAAGLVLKNSYYGEKILGLGHQKAEESVRKFVSPDGIFRSGSLKDIPHAIELFVILNVIFKKAGIKTSNLFLERFHKMFDVLASLLRKDDSTALIGDPFVQRILPFSDETEKFPLVYAPSETGKGTYKKFIPVPLPDLLFIKALDAVTTYADIPDSKYSNISYGYQASGIFVLRNEDIHITVDASENFLAGNKTSGHNDLLSFELFYRNEKIIADPGCHSFYRETGMRNSFRSVKNHNTIYIDDEEPVELSGIFGIKEDLTKPKITEWHSDESEDILSVQNYAYARFADPVILKRIFRFQKEKNKIIIRDEIFGGSTHHAFSSLVFAPGVNIIQDGPAEFRFNSGVEGEIRFTVPSGILSCTIQEIPFSPYYGELTVSKKIALSLTAQFPVYITTEICLL